MNMRIIFTLIVLVDLKLCDTADISYSYDNQEAWKTLPSSSCNGRRQSPVNIITGNAKIGSELINLRLSNWDILIDGKFMNNGHTIVFHPSRNDSTVHNHLGNYTVQQFHFHWGRSDTEGSEHQVDGRKYDAEIHFVSTKNGEANISDGGYYSVIGIFCEADPQLGNSDPWNNITLNQLVAADSEHTSSIVYQTFLPDNLDYYLYEGSLTTPNCNEIVQWFVVKKTIKIPAAFLQQLRQLTDSNSEKITYNFRYPQPLNSRSILTMSSATTPKAYLSISLFAVTTILLVILLS